LIIGDNRLAVVVFPWPPVPVKNTDSILFP
jgi:hypothetical protein